MYRIIYNALFDSEKNLKFSLVKWWNVMDWNHGTGITCSRWADSATPVYKSSANDEESPIYKEAIKFKTILFRSNPTVTTAIPANGPGNKHHFSASIPVTSFFSPLLPLKQKNQTMLEIANMDLPFVNAAMWQSFEDFKSSQLIPWAWVLVAAGSRKFLSNL